MCLEMSRHLQICTEVKKMLLLKIGIECAELGLFKIGTDMQSS